MTLRRYLVAAALLLGACADPALVMVDQVGHVYPEACRGDLSGVKATVRVMPRATMQAISPAGAEALGMTFPGNPPIIWISDALSGWRYEDVLRHERCHVVAGAWHGGWMPTK